MKIFKRFISNKLIISSLLIAIVLFILYLFGIGDSFVAFIAPVLPLLAVIKFIVDSFRTPDSKNDSEALVTTMENIATLLGNQSQVRETNKEPQNSKYFAKSLYDINNLNDDDEFLYAICESRFYNEDYKYAFENLLLLAQKKQKKAFHVLGFMYHHGFYVCKDIAQAYIFYSKAVEQNYPNSQRMLGHMHYWGWDDIEIDKDKGYLLLSKAAEQGDEQAKETIAKLNAHELSNEYNLDSVTEHTWDYQGNLFITKNNTFEEITENIRRFFEDTEDSLEIGDLFTIRAEKSLILALSRFLFDCAPQNEQDMIMLTELLEADIEDIEGVINHLAYANTNQTAKRYYEQSKILGGVDFSDIVASCLMRCKPLCAPKRLSDNLFTHVKCEDDIPLLGKALLTNGVHPCIAINESEKLLITACIRYMFEDNKELAKFDTLLNIISNKRAYFKKAKKRTPSSLALRDYKDYLSVITNKDMDRKISNSCKIKLDCLIKNWS